MAGTTPTDRSVAPPLDVLFLAESESEVAADLERLAELLPGLVAEVRLRFVRGCPFLSCGRLVLYKRLGRCCLFGGAVERRP